MKIQKVFFIVITLLFLITISSCNTNIKVKIYLVKDDLYFTNPIGYVEIDKEHSAQIDEEDIKDIFKMVHGVSDESVFVDLVDYKLFKDASLTQELDKTYKLCNNESIYVLVTAKLNSLKMGADNSPETSIWYTGSIALEEKDENFFYPLNSLYVSGYYIPLDSETVSFDLLYEVFVNYRRTQEGFGCENGLTKKEIENNIDLNCKEKFSFIITSYEQLNNTSDLKCVVLNENNTFTFDQQRYLIDVCYDEKDLGSLALGLC